MSWLETTLDKLWLYWLYLSAGRTLAIMAGLGFALVAVLLWLASKTRWGKSKPLTKCIVLSVLAHVWLLMYALGHRSVLPQGDPKGKQDGMVMAFEVVEQFGDEQLDLLGAEGLIASKATSIDMSSHQVSPWEQVSESINLPRADELLESLVRELPPSPAKLDTVTFTPLPPPPSAEEIRDETISELTGEPTESAGSVADNSSQASAMAGADPMLNPITAVNDFAPVSPQSVTVSDSSASHEIRDQYQLRQSAQRLEISRAYGADEDSEAAVEAALTWLARSQSVDGSWNAARFGAGTETRALGEYRYGTGDRADTGVSGLALLAFLSAGHSHLDGKHQMVVAKGLSYLLHVQMPSGDLSGPKLIGNDRAAVNARMYCHSIAMLALAEAYAMTHDPALREGLVRAAQYTINAQDVRGGGWRYHPGDSGDLSLFGWKAMALHSVQLSGIEVPPIVERRMQNFLMSCTVGNGGLARYRPGEGRPSETMTAEALACRLLLNYPLSPAARQEAVQMLMNHLPGDSPDNVYYWYYATLALFQLQDENWRIWNQKLKSHLLQTQLPAYHSEAGSWNPDNLWGGYGGRVYSTAMSCLCLEVYYRYLPMYQRARLALPRQQNY